MSGKCEACKNRTAFALPFSMAFQPIFDLRTGSVFAHEALARGLNGEGAGVVLAMIDASNRYAFDQQCRVKAIELATRLDLPASGASLSINFMPNAVYEPRACISLTLTTAMQTGFPLNRLIFEFTENEELDTIHVGHILRCYRDMGFRTAIDDFGAGRAGLTLLAKIQPDIVKLDMDLVRGVDASPVKRTIVKHTLRLLDELGIVAICEGVETRDELVALRDLGANLFQGYVLARPSFEALSAASADRVLADLRVAA